MRGTGFTLSRERGRVYRPGVRRFLPNRRASMDQAPGPSIARAALITANRISAQKLPFPENAAHPSKIARAPPAMGVHKPTLSSRAAAPGIALRNEESAEVNSAPSSVKTAIAATSRRHKIPIPGEPRAKVEYSRCKTHVPVTIVNRPARESKP